MKVKKNFFKYTLFNSAFAIFSRGLSNSAAALRSPRVRGAKDMYGHGSTYTASIDGVMKRDSQFEAPGMPTMLHECSSSPAGRHSLNLRVGRIDPDHARRCKRLSVGRGLIWRAGAPQTRVRRLQHSRSPLGAH